MFCFLLIIWLLFFFKCTTTYKLEFERSENKQYVQQCCRKLLFLFFCHLFYSVWCRNRFQFHLIEAVHLLPQWGSLSSTQELCGPQPAWASGSTLFHLGVKCWGPANMSLTAHCVLRALYQHVPAERRSCTAWRQRMTEDCEKQIVFPGWICRKWCRKWLTSLDDELRPVAVLDRCHKTHRRRREKGNRRSRRRSKSFSNPGANW